LTVGGTLLAEWRADKLGPAHKDSLGNTWTLKGDLVPTAFAPSYTAEWNGATPFKLGSNWLWLDASTFRLRRKVGSAPSSDTDGVIVGTPPQTTTTALSSISNAINTTGKYQGKQVYCSDHARPHWTNGSAAGDVWFDYAWNGSAMANVTAHTPA
jgi:hypothetical protein